MSDHAFVIDRSTYDLAYVFTCSCGHKVTIVHANPTPGVNALYAHINEMRNNVRV